MNTTSQIFDLKRCGLCLRRDITVNGRSLLLKLMIMTAVVTIMLLFFTWPWLMGMNDNAVHFQNDYYGNVQPWMVTSVFKFAGLLFCSLGASLFMSGCATPGNRLQELMYPASTLEKYVSRWLICIAGVTVAYMLCFSIASVLRYGIDLMLLSPECKLRYFGTYDVITQGKDMASFFLKLVTVQATFALGSTIWTKSAWMKTFGALFVYCCIVVLCIGITVNTYFNGHGLGSVSEQSDAIWVVIGSIWTLACYVIAYFRMRELEIVNRL